MARIMNCNIINNSTFGLVSMNGANTAINETTISNNGDTEIVGSYSAFPLIHYEFGGHVYYGYNTIADDDYEPGSWDQYLLLCTNYENPPIDCRTNYIDISDTDRFFPSIDAYLFDGQLSPDKELFYEGLSFVYDRNFEQAKIIMKSVILEYPETKTATEAITALTYIEKFGEKKFAELRNYLESINEELYPHLDMVKYKALTATYMGEKDYETAIYRLEETINNPPSYLDSLYAFIDEGYCYLKLEELGDRGTVDHCTFKPCSFEEFSSISKDLEQEILNLEMGMLINDDEHPDNQLSSIPVLKGNYPNPFNPTTTISFTIPEECEVELSVFNIKGQKVRMLAKDSFTKGKHSIVWNGKSDAGKSVSSGIYFYKLNVNGVSNQIRKCILMK